MNIEIYKNIENYEGLYQVSNLGNVKSLGNDRTRKDKLLKPATDKDGYLQVNLYKNGKSKKYKIHRLVAEAFIPNPLNKPCIDHIDTNPSNNRVENLKWCTRKENMNNPISLVKMSECRKGKLNHRSKPIIQLSLNGSFIKKWDCSMDIQRALGYNPSGITQCCNGKLKSAYNYKWCFAS